MYYESNGSLIVSQQEFEKLIQKVRKRTEHAHARDFIRIQVVDGKIRIYQPDEHHECGDFDLTAEAYDINIKGE